jgi:hypothetical protein
MPNPIRNGLLATLGVLAVTVGITLWWQPYSARSKYHESSERYAVYSPVAEAFLRAALAGDSADLSRLSIDPGAVAWALARARMDAEGLARRLDRLTPTSGREHGDTATVTFGGDQIFCDSSAITLDFVTREKTRLVAGAMSGCAMPRVAQLQ